MKDEILIKNSDLFYSLSYEDRLKFWDNNNLDFRNQSHDFDEIVIIKPIDAHQQILYNKWLFDHYRNQYLNKIADGKGFDLINLNSEKLVENYDRAIVGKSTAETRNFTRNEILRCNGLLKIKKVKDAIIDMVYSKISTNNEEGIFNLVTDLSSIYVEIPQISRIWDITVYKVYLERQLSLPKGQSQNVDKRKYKLKELNDEQITFLHEQLKGKFIPKDDDYINFKHIFMNKHGFNTTKIKWIIIDDNKLVNKIPLILLANQIVEKTSRYGNSFIVSNFVTHTKNKKKDISLDNLKNSRRELKKKNQERLNEEDIMKIVSDMFLI